MSDDASGRLVSLVLRKVINQSRKQAGLEQVQTYFLATGRHDSKAIMQKIKEFLKSKKPDIGKALLVTEYISTGESIEKLIKILDKLKIPFDLAALSIGGSPDDYNVAVRSRLNYGSRDTAGLSFWNKRQVTGVEKDTASGSPHPIKTTDPSAKTTLLAARRDVTRLVNALVQKDQQDLSQ